MNPEFDVKFTYPLRLTLKGQLKFAESDYFAELLFKKKSVAVI